MAELKAELPDIERGFKNIANSILQMAKDFAPFLHALDAFSHSDFAKYVADGLLVPSGVDLGDAKHADRARRLICRPALDPGGFGHGLYGAAECSARKGIDMVESGRVHVIVEGKPGTSVRSIQSTGNVTATARRGVLGSSS